MKSLHKKAPLLVALSFMIFSGCKKETSKTESEAYFFKYVINGKEYGSSSNKILNNNQNYNAWATSTGVLTASKSSDCNVNGNAPCYDATLAIQGLSKGVHSINKIGNALHIIENSTTDIWISENDGEGTVTLTEVGNIGGVVAGTFVGKAAKNSSNSLINISGSFKLYRTR